MALRIKHLRTERGWSQQHLADKSRMSRSQLAMIEQETRPANTLRLTAIAAALDVQVRDLFDGTDGVAKIIDLYAALTPENQETIVRLAEALVAARPKA